MRLVGSEIELLQVMFLRIIKCFILTNRLQEIHKYALKRQLGQYGMCINCIHEILIEYIRFKISCDVLIHVVGGECVYTCGLFHPERKACCHVCSWLFCCVCGCYAYMSLFQTGCSMSLCFIHFPLLDLCLNYFVFCSGPYQENHCCLGRVRAVSQ